MKSPSKSGWRAYLILLVALACVCIWDGGHVSSARAQAALKHILKTEKTLCVGRFLIDVPYQAQTMLSGAMMDGFQIDITEEDEAAFRKRLDEREAEIVAQGVATTAEQPGGLVWARELNAAGMVGRTLVYGRGRTYGMESGRRIDVEWVSVESRAHLGGVTFTLSMEYASEADAQLAEAYLARLRLRSENEVPEVPGFCIRRGVFAEPLPKHTIEHVTLHLGLPGHADTGLAFSSMPGGPTDNDLLARFRHADADASALERLQVRKLRVGLRTINGIAGEEVLERVRELNLTTGYNFMWEARGLNDDPMKPYVLLNMETGTNPRPGGKPVDSSLNEDVVIALWDRVSSSIRLRGKVQPNMERP